jgi:arylsulfatase A-like enzyme
MTKMGPNGSNNKPLKGQKGDTWEGGIRVPFFVQWKGKLPAGKVYDKPVISLDILPTAVAAAGGQVEPDWKLDGVDLLPYLTGANAGKPHETLYWRFGPQWAIRKGDFKLVVNNIDGVGKPPALYNLAEDIGESKDLAMANPEKAKELHDAWKAWNAEQMEPRWRPVPKKKN